MSAPRQVCKLARFGLTTENAAQLATFYESAFGFHRIATKYLSGAAFEGLMGVRGGADCITLGLGREIVELLQFDHSGRPYPAEAVASDLLFQHFAIVVADIGRAWQRLRGVDGWSAITRDTPQILPKTSGGVSAFKFRDPEGHPLELLAFPTSDAPARWQAVAGDATSLGIDHSAISVTDTTVSCAFYGALGLQVSARSFNSGLEQDALDDLSEAQVDVTALAPANSTPHVELLCYRSQPRDPPVIYRSNDIAATRLVLELCGPSDEYGDSIPHCLLDPDAHHLLIVPELNSKRAR